MDREQVRRDATKAKQCGVLEAGQAMRLLHTVGQQTLALLAELEQAERERDDFREKWKASEREVGRLAMRLSDVERDSEVAFGQFQGHHSQAEALATVSDLAADWTDDDLTVLQLRARLKSIASVVSEQAQKQR